MAGEWTPTTPIPHTLISDLPTEIKDVKNNTATVFEKEHRELGDGNSGGGHLQGSAICFVQTTAPPAAPDGSAFVTADLGRLWYDTTNAIFKILTALTPTWTALPSLTASQTITGDTTLVGTNHSEGPLSVDGDVTKLMSCAPLLPLNSKAHANAIK